MNSFPFFTDICILFSLINDICRWACYRLFGFSGRYERLVGFFLFTAIPFPFLFTFFRRSGTLVDGVQVDCTHYFYIFQRRLCYFERSGFRRLFHLYGNFGLHFWCYFSFFFLSFFYFNPGYFRFFHFFGYFFLSFSFRLFNLCFYRFRLCFFLRIQIDMIDNLNFIFESHFIFNRNEFLFLFFCIVVS